MSLRDYLRALRKNWLLVVVWTFVGTGLAVTYVYRATPIYEGSVEFFATTPSTDSRSPLQGDQFGQQRVNSYVELLNSQRVAKRVLDATSLNLSERQVMRAVNGEADLNTVLFTAYVHHSSPGTVEKIVDALANEFPQLVEEIESQGGRTDPPVRLDVVSGPSVGDEPVSPVEQLAIGLGVVLGIILGVAFALVRALLDRTIREPETLRETAGVPVLGRIPQVASSKRTQLLRDGGKSWSRAEAFRQLRTNLQFVDIERPVAVLVVTSSVAAEGKSTTAADLAMSFAQAGRRVLLVDADLRRPTLAGLLGLERSVGLTNVLAGQVGLHEVVQPWGEHGMRFLASGPIPPNPSELLGSEHMVDVIDQARQAYDLIIIDTAPLLPVTDGAIAAARADGAVVVVRYGRTRRGEVERAVDSLRAVDARVVGAVLNGVPVKETAGYTYEGYRTAQASTPEEDDTVPASRWRRRRSARKQAAGSS